MSMTGMMQRCWEHDYCAPSFYMITIVTEPRRGCLSVVQGSGTGATADGVRLELSPIGEVVCEVWRRTSAVYGGVEACECVAMPDHFHYAAAHGAVLVSPCISPGEKEIARAALEGGRPLIVLLENGFPPLYKPAGRYFEACASGRLLMVAPFPYHRQRQTITREQCLALNSWARVIVGRAGAFATRDLPSGVHIRLVAPEEMRVKAMMKVLSETEVTARDEMYSQDDSRAHFVREFFCGDINDPLAYHMVVNTGLMSIDDAAGLVEFLLAGKARQCAAAPP